MTTLSGTEAVMKDHDLFVRYAQTGDRALRDQLVGEHLGLARHLARRFEHRGEAYDDLVQVASMALVKALDRFDPDRGVKFSTFAVRTIVGELKRHFRDKGWALKVPRSLQESYLELNSAAENVTQRLGRAPTVRELADEMGTTEERVLEAQEVAASYRTLSFDAPVGHDASDTLAEVAAVEEPGYHRVEQLTDLQSVVATLPERDQLVLRLRFVESRSQAEIGSVIGVTQMQVCRILNRTMDVIRHRLEGANSKQCVRARTPQAATKPALSS
jgi:RNA polymerase sigma-B factor